ncbi:hypothetical protein T10_6063 [Trichinella papuae]|uniref:Uncharacterized protein n=1 Tax=Trichinella papuae TaxID=268474 RepID=A0A0V1M962_9BILA|nr:hypothetical protein T10_6063 [Trichinella papuae]
MQVRCATAVQDRWYNAVDLKAIIKVKIVNSNFRITTVIINALNGRDKILARKNIALANVISHHISDHSPTMTKQV